MNMFVKAFRAIVKGAAKIAQETNAHRQQTTVSILWNEAAQEAAAIVRAHLATAMLFRNRAEIREYAIKRVVDDGMLLEFGVHRGASIKLFARGLRRRGDPRTVYGFDSFAGLQEDWTGHYIAAGLKFDLKGKLPSVPRNVALIKGWIDDTLPDFLATHDGPIAFVHIDTDSYSAANTILRLCKPRFRSGTVILFDEFFGYPNWRNHEYKACNEHFAPGDYEFIAFSVKQALIRLR